MAVSPPVTSMVEPPAPARVRVLPVMSAVPSSKVMLPTEMPAVSVTVNAFTASVPALNTAWSLAVQPASVPPVPVELVFQLAVASQLPVGVAPAPAVLALVSQ